MERLSLAILSTTAVVGVRATYSAFNQVAVLPSGNGNGANFTQIGIGSSNAAISQ